MKFADTPVRDALGGILAHSVTIEGRSVRKGRRLDEALASEFLAAGVTSLFVAMPETGDVLEDEAATRVAQAIAGSHLLVQPASRGRVDIVARQAGLVTVDTVALEAVNGVDEAVTVATLPGFEPVGEGERVATIKIIPFAVPSTTVAACIGLLKAPPLAVAPFSAWRTGLVMTTSPAVKSRVLDRTASVVTARIEGFGLCLGDSVRAPHRTPDLADTITRMAMSHDIVLVYGASAISDRKDVIPAAVEAAGGVVDHLGMPVDPGNLLLLAHIGSTRLLGLPGCARSPQPNGLDLVLGRLAAGIRVTGADIQAMGVGGLLKGRPSGVLPVAGSRREMPAAIVLAAGRSRRMGGRNKLLMPIDGVSMVRHVVNALLSAGIAVIRVVTGHQAPAVRAALEGCPVSFVDNSEHEAGLSTSLKAGLDALPASCGAALVCLGDMPAVTGPALRSLVRAWQGSQTKAIVVPTWNGRRGNPVLWDSSFFQAMRRVTGDAGARHLIGEYGDYVIEVAMDDGAVLVDIDTPEDASSIVMADGQADREERQR